MASPGRTRCQRFLGVLVTFASLIAAGGVEILVAESRRGESVMSRLPNRLPPGNRAAPTAVSVQARHGHRSGPRRAPHRADARSVRGRHHRGTAHARRGQPAPVAHGIRRRLPGPGGCGAPAGTCLPGLARAAGSTPPRRRAETDQGAHRDGPFGLVHVVRDAHIRSVAEVSAELRAVKTDPISTATGRLLGTVAPARRRLRHRAAHPRVPCRRCRRTQQASMRCRRPRRSARRP